MKPLKLVAVLLALLTTTCAPQSRMGMVVDPETGLQMGSMIEKNLVMDSGQLTDRRIKINIRNTSGDPVFDLNGARAQIERAFVQKGYEIATGSDFALLFDVNVRYSGQASRDKATELGLLGAAGGGLGAWEKSRSATGTAAGVIAGAAIGAIVGSYVRDETYLVVAEVVIGVMDAGRGTTGKTIVFDASPQMKSDTEQRSGVRPFSQRMSTGIAVYAGGRNTNQGHIAQGVRQRFTRIVSDVI
jgi:hypothetical protein